MSEYTVKPCPYALDGAFYQDCPRDVHGLVEGERCSDCPARPMLDAAGRQLEPGQRVVRTGGFGARLFVDEVRELRWLDNGRWPEVRLAKGMPTTPDRVAVIR